MEEERNSERCIICLVGFTSENPKISVGDKGIQSLLNFCELRQNENLKERLERDIQSSTEILVHKSCRRDFTDKRRRTDGATTNDEPRPKLLRSSSGSFDFKQQCFLCGRSSTIDTKHPDRSKIHLVTFLDFHRNLLEKCKRRNDTWSEEVHNRLNYCNDLVADEGRYHRLCLQRFMTDKKSSVPDGGERGRPRDEGMFHWFEMLCIWLEVDSDAELHTLGELHDKMTSFAGDESVYSVKRLKQKLQERYGNKLHFTMVDGKQNVACFQGMADFYLNEMWKEERRKDKEKDAERIVTTAAKVIMAEIRETKYDTSKYPKTMDISDVTNEWVPKLLKIFLQVLVKSNLKQNSIGQIIVQAAKPKSSLMPIPFGLAVELDHIFGSKWLLDELYQLGFSSTYTEVNRFKQSAMATEDATKTAVTLPPGTFSQHVADNVDHNLCTLDGKNTFHGMGMIQVSTNESGLKREEKTIDRLDLQRVASVTSNKGIAIEQYIKGNYDVLSKKEFCDVKELKFNLCTALEKNIDLLWEMSFTFSDVTRPNWSGFMQAYRKGPYPGKSEVTLLPIINLNPNDHTCIYSTLLFVIDQSKQANSGTPCITFDQPLWLKAVEIITEKSLKILCRLGGFHTLMSYLGSIGSTMKGSGIAECLQLVYGENAVQHMMTGKAIARALRGHFLLQSALRLKIINNLLQEDIVSESDLREVKAIYESFTSNNTPLEDEFENCKVLEKLSTVMEQMMSSLGSLSRTSKLWVQYIHCIDNVKLFIAAERTGDWQNHLAATLQMLNLFAATGHINYAKSARLYLQMMSNLPSTYPDLHEQFTQNGYHVVRRSDRFWNGIWTDLSIEQVLMRSLKTRGGLTRGRGMTENVVLTWVHTMHVCASIHDAMTTLTGNTHKTSNQHAELGKSRLKRDNDDLEKIQVWIESHDPFDKNEPLLRSIATGVTATEADGINCDDAESIGEAIQHQLTGVSYSEAKIRKKDRIKTLEALEVGVRIDKEKVHVDPLLLFSRLLVLIEREEDIRSYFQYELTAVPTSLFQNSMMRKSSKAKLGQALKKDVTASTYKTDQSFHILDGGALLHKVKWLKDRSYQSILDQYTKYVNKKYGRSCIVFDGYANGPYVKDHEHKRRTGKMSAFVSLENLEMVPTFNQEVFLKNEQNKSQFISFLSNELRREGHDVRNSLGDADTQIVSAALEYAEDSNKDVVVVAADTDILVLLMFHWKNGMRLYMLSDAPSNKGDREMWRIEDLVIKAGDDITSHILFIHAWSGCDTTSALFGQGKTSSLKKFKTNRVFQESAEVFEDETATAEEVEQKGLELLMFSYGGKENWSMEDLRYHQFMKAAATSKTTIKPQSLAPTKNAAKYHFLRIHLQVIEWKTLMSVELSPVDWGWKLSNGSYEPIMTDLNAAPDNILRFIRCNCNVSKKSPCSTNVCSCRRHGLPCVSACGNCNGVECKNCDNEEFSPESDEDSVESDEEADRNIFDIFDV